MPSKAVLAKKRIQNSIKNLIKNPYHMIIALSLISLFLLIVLPMVFMVKNTFVLSANELRRVSGKEAGDFTLYYWQYLLTSKLSAAHLITPFKHSLTIAFFVTILAVPLGFGLAWLMVRSDLPEKSG
jgi:iron(III) transport system permease protein